MSELMSHVHSALRARHYSRRTEQAYRLWVRRFIRFHGVRHPADMAAPEINDYGDEVLKVYEVGSTRHDAGERRVKGGSDG